MVLSPHGFVQYCMGQMLTISMLPLTAHLQVLRLETNACMNSIFSKNIIRMHAAHFQPQHSYFKED